MSPSHKRSPRALRRKPDPPSRRAGNLVALGILLLTLALALAWSGSKLLWNDEFLSFYTDSVPTLADVVHVQRTAPISLDPPAYHLLSHVAMDAFGRSATALRLPALAGFLLLQWSLFVLVRRIAGSRAALVAMALPLCTASFRYAAEGRPYGLLLGLYAASVACWFTAAQTADHGTGDEPVLSTEAGQLHRPAERREPSSKAPTETASSRRWPLLGLGLSLAAAITSHYFGVLILLPVTAAEAVRTLQRRRFDLPMIAALAAGVLSVGLILPFKAALKPYQQHYYTSTVNLRNVSQGYRELFVRYNAWPMSAQHVVAALLAVAVLALVIAVILRYPRRPAATEPASLWAALLTLALLPFLGYLFGKFVTHTMEVRYVIAALIPFAVSVALLLARPLRSNRVFYGVLAAEVILGVLFVQIQIRAEHQASAQLLATLQQKAPALPDSEPIYIQTLSDDFLRTYYTSDPTLRSRYVLLYDEDREVRWQGHNTNAVTAKNLQHFTTLRTARYTDVATQRSALFLIAEPGGWNWLRPELLHDPGLIVTPIGSMGDLPLVRVTFGLPSQ